MAKYCELCGKKDTFFTEDPFNLDDGKILCYKCASPIANNLNALYYASNRDIFEKNKSEILAVCREKYNSEITKCIIKKIDTRELRISELEAAIKQKEDEDNLKLEMMSHCSPGLYFRNKTFHVAFIS